MEYNDDLEGQKMTAIKAQRGIENIEEIYRQVQDEEQQDEDEGEEGGESNGEKNGQ